MSFLSSLLISLHYKSVKGVSYTRTNISTGEGCLVEVSVKVSTKVKWFSIMGFLVIGYFQGYPQLYFIAGLAGLVNL